MVKSDLNFPSIVMMSSVELSKEQQVKALLFKFRGSEAVQKFVRKYGKSSTQASYLFVLNKYFVWLRSIGVEMVPDEMIKDNLRCVYGSDPTDVATKCEHEYYDLQ